MKKIRYITLTVDIILGIIGLASGWLTEEPNFLLTFVLTGLIVADTAVLAWNEMR